MTMFSRSDKVSDSVVAAKTPERKEETAAVAASSPERRAPPVQRPREPGSMPSVISKALKITGQLESSEDIQIDGDVEGDIRGLTIKVGQGSTINGTVYGDAVELSGTVKGKIEAKKVVLTSTAHMAGDIVHQYIEIASGAFIDGHCRPGFGNAEEKSPRAAQRPGAPDIDLAKKQNGGVARAGFGAA